jgi:hypothetical protein
MRRSCCQCVAAGEEDLERRCLAAAAAVKMEGKPEF